MTMTIAVSRSCNIPIATWFSAKKAGTGHPHIMWPMEKYISMTRNTSEAASRFFSSGVSLSRSISSCSETAELAPAPVRAPEFPPLKGRTVSGFLNCSDYLSRRSASLNSHGIGEQTNGTGCDSVNLRDCLFDSGTACSTAHTCNIILLHLYHPYFISFCRVVTSSSITS